MTVSNRMRSLLNPTTVALVGASEDSRFAQGFVRNVTALGNPSEVYYVNPKRATVFGATAYPSLAALPVTVDCAVLGVPSRAVTEVVQRGAEAGVKSFVVYAAGFAEGGQMGAARQAELAELSRQAGVTLLGPQANGYVNRVRGRVIYADPVPADMPRGPVGVIAQSGGAANAIINQSRGIGFSYVIVTGNEAVVTAEDVLQFYVDDPDTKVIVAFIESLRRGQDFIRVAQAARRVRKPIIMLKVGLTASAGRISKTHTGAVTGSARVNAAAFESLAVIQVNDFSELLETAALFSRVKRLPSSPGTGLITNSGGGASLAADVAEQVGLSLPSFAPDTIASLRRTFELSPDVPVDNPMDGGIGYASSVPYRERYSQALRAIAADPAVGIVAMLQDGRQTPSPLHVWMLEAATQCGAALEKPFVLFSHVNETYHPELQPMVDQSGAPALRGTRESLLAIKRLARYAQDADAPEPDYRADRARIGAIVSGCGGPQGIGPALLREYGIPQAEARPAASPEDAARLAAEMGFPVVIKVLSPDILHKTDVGGVRVGLKTAAEVRETARFMLEEVARRRPAARLTGVTVSRQMPVVCELLLGMRSDPQFGPIVAVGLGGVLVEALDLVVLGLPPFTPESAAALLRRIPAHQILNGFRGQPPVDLVALAQIVVRFGELALDCAGLIEEFEINPLIAVAGEPKFVAADMRAILARHDGADVDPSAQIPLRAGFETKSL